MRPGAALHIPARQRAPPDVSTRLRTIECASGIKCLYNPSAGGRELPPTANQPLARAQSRRHGTRGHGAPTRCGGVLGACMKMNGGPGARDDRCAACASAELHEHGYGMSDSTRPTAAVCTQVHTCASFERPTRVPCSCAASP
eukprot:1963677-Prymnesium_polylepis.1